MAYIPKKKCTFQKMGLKKIKRNKNGRKAMTSNERTRVLVAWRKGLWGHSED